MKIIQLLGTCLFFLIACSSNKESASLKYAKYVDPFIGTDFHGHTYPGATTPFGAVQLSPDTRRGNWDACGGYHRSDSVMFGFSHTHLNGTGCLDLGDLLFHPTTSNAELKGTGYIFKPLSFSHKNEVAEPGFYSVKLDNQIFAELTATAHAGIHRYTFPEKDGKLIIDLAHALDNEQIYESAIIVNSSTEICGMRKTKGWVDNQYIFFVAQFSVPFSKEELVSAGKPVAAKAIEGQNIQVVLSFTSKEPVVVKVGISTVSLENAKLNLLTEVKGFDFEKVKSEAQKKWDDALSAYDISGASDEQKTTFYTAVYHTMVTPNQISDVNGEYRGADMKTYQAGNRKVYSTFSIWDTFRAWNPLMTLTDTTLVSNMVNAMLNFYDQSGELPIWPLSSGETGCMIGYHSASVIWDAYSKNIRGFDAHKALKAMVVSANKNAKGTSPYLDLGFIPSGTRKESVSCLLENSYDDWCISQLAKSLGDSLVAKQFGERAMFYKNVFDGSTGFFRGRQKDGIWDSPFNPFEVGRAYTEATAWQYRFFVPHDVNGMINLLGGNDAFVLALDSLFNTTSKFEGQQSDISGLVGQYAHGNEPSHHIAYLYSYAGRPWKTQKMVRQLLNDMYKPTPDGIIGNEDCGQMSSWYVLSSLGLYAVCPGSGEFVLTSPLFEKATIRLANGKKLEIIANNPSENEYIKEVRLNKQLIDKNFITYEQIMQGGQLEFVLAPVPNLKRGISNGSMPYSFSNEKEVSVPYISNDISFFENETAFHCGCATADAEIRYTLNGSEPNEKSAIYTKPVKIDKSLTIKLKAFKPGYRASSTSAYQASKAQFIPSVNRVFTKNGMDYVYYEGTFARTSEIVKKGIFKKKGQCNEPTTKVADIADHYGIIFSGYIFAPADGVYTFLTSSDDGSKLIINNIEVVDNDGSHGDISASGRIALKKGFHPYQLLYFEDYEGEAISMSWKVPGSNKVERILPKDLFLNN
jgi:predicted alpha-1,2-mannosidase